MQGRERHSAIAPGVFNGGIGRDLEFDQMLHGFEGVPKQKTSSRKRAVQVAEHRKLAAFDSPQQNRGTPDLVKPALEGGGFEIRVNLVVDLD